MNIDEYFLMVVKKPYRQWLKDFNETKPEYTVNVIWKAMYKDYQKYCKKNGFEPDYRCR